MYRKLLELYPWITPNAIHYYEWLRVRYYFDSSEELNFFEAKDKERSVLNSFVWKVVREFSRWKFLNWTIIYCLWKNKKINKSFFKNNFPTELKNLFNIKNGEIIHYDESYFIIFDIKSIPVDIINLIIKNKIFEDHPGEIEWTHYIGNVYFYPPSMNRLLNLYDDRGMDICYLTPNDYF